MDYEELSKQIDRYLDDNDIVILKQTSNTTVEILNVIEVRLGPDKDCVIVEVW